MNGGLYRAPRRWPAVAGAGVVGVLAGAVITGGVVWATSDPIEVTQSAGVATPESSATVSPIPVAKADRQTCQAWNDAGKLINEAAEDLSVIPQGTTILDPAVREDPQRAAAVQQAAERFTGAADILGGHITGGSTQILADTAHSTVSSLRALSTAYRTYDEGAGEAIGLARTAAASMSALCKRLVP